MSSESSISQAKRRCFSIPRRLGRLGLLLATAHVLLHVFVPASFLFHEGGLLVAGVFAFAWGRVRPFRR